MIKIDGVQDVSKLLHGEHESQQKVTVGYNYIDEESLKVKKIGDRLSKEQIDRLNDIIDCGGIAFICTQQGLNPILNKWTKMQY